MRSSSHARSSGSTGQLGANQPNGPTSQPPTEALEEGERPATVLPEALLEHLERLLGFLREPDDTLAAAADREDLRAFDLARRLRRALVRPGEERLVLPALGVD